MTVDSMDNFAKTEAAELLQLQTEYLDALDKAEQKHHRGSISVMNLVPLLEVPQHEPAPSTPSTDVSQYSSIAGSVSTVHLFDDGAATQTRGTTDDSTTTRSAN
jgi:hypothetical protein